PMNRPASRRLSEAAIHGPRLLMSWEDWLTFAAALIAFLAVGVSIQQARWVPGMPSVLPTILWGLVIGLFAARIRMPGVVIHIAALVLGVILVTLIVQGFADGATLFDRIADIRMRMVDWWHVVIANEISNDRLPFVTLVHTACFLSCYIAAYAIYRW